MSPCFETLSFLMPCLQIPSSNHRGNRRHLWSDMSLGGQMYQLQTLQPTSGAGTGQDGGVETSTEVTKNRTTQRTEKSDVSVSDDALFESIMFFHKSSRQNSSAESLCNLHRLLRSGVLLTRYGTQLPRDGVNFKMYTYAKISSTNFHSEISQTHSFRYQANYNNQQCPSIYIYHISHIYIYNIYVYHIYIYKYHIYIYIIYIYI